MSSGYKIKYSGEYVDTDDLFPLYTSATTITFPDTGFRKSGGTNTVIKGTTWYSYDTLNTRLTVNDYFDNTGSSTNTTYVVRGGFPDFYSSATQYKCTSTGTVYLYIASGNLYLGPTKGSVLSTSYYKKWSPSDFKDGVLPDRIICIMQGAGGGGGADSLNGLIFHGGGGGGSGAMCPVVLFTSLLKENNSRAFKFTVGKGGAGGTHHIVAQNYYAGSGGISGGATTMAYSSNGSSYTTYVTIGGGGGGGGSDTTSAGSGGAAGTTSFGSESVYGRLPMNNNPGSGSGDYSGYFWAFNGLAGAAAAADGQSSSGYYIYTSYKLSLQSYSRYRRYIGGKSGGADGGGAASYFGDGGYSEDGHRDGVDGSGGGGTRGWGSHAGGAGGDGFIWFYY